MKKGKIDITDLNVTNTVTGIDNSDVGLGNVENVDATHVSINAQTGTSYTLVLTDDNKMVTCTNASAITLTVPPNSSVAFPVGTTIAINQGSSGAVTLTPGSGVTLQNKDGLVTQGQWSVATLIKIATDTWIAFGSLGSS